MISSLIVSGAFLNSGSLDNGNLAAELSQYIFKASDAAMVFRSVATLTQVVLAWSFPITAPPFKTKTYPV
ncbi:hypothetical protein Tco_0456092 [Tanacetum coccineum]